MTVKQIPCNPANFGGFRAGPVEYLVVHYTAGRNDTAENNGIYFAREQTGTSAHYFVDEHEVVQSVPDDRVAWHCGGASYRHGQCRNSNAIGVEICSRWENGSYFFHPRALENAKTLLRQLMVRYAVPPERVLRHYDVTGKLCPAPFVGAGQGDWERFRRELMVYQTLQSVPDWAKQTAQKLVDRKILQGNGQDLELTRDMLRLLVMLDRAGIFEQ